MAYIPRTALAPSDADFLVGTADADLSAEIAVGTSPGGELGGTWASPTVDTTHSGSAHHAESHSVASHSDTTATGAELEELTDGSETSLHSHAGGGSTLLAPTMITPFSACALGVPIAAIATTAPVSAGFANANVAYYYPFQLDEDVTVVKLGWLNGSTATGNIDMGIYNESGTRQVSTGSTGQSGTTRWQEVDIADTALPAGRYYLAIVASSTSTTIWRSAPSRDFCKSMGVAQEASALPLPATATFAAMTTGYVPMIAASLRTLLA